MKKLKEERVKEQPSKDDQIEKRWRETKWEQDSLGLRRTVLRVLTFELCSFPKTKRIHQHSERMRTNRQEGQ
jgi:hypothetical protein